MQIYSLNVQNIPPDCLRRWNSWTHDSIYIYMHFFFLLRLLPTALSPLVNSQTILAVTLYVVPRAVLCLQFLLLWHLFFFFMMMNNAQRICTIIIASFLYDIFHWWHNKMSCRHKNKQACNNNNKKKIHNNNNNNVELRRKMQLQ